MRNQDIGVHFLKNLQWIWMKFSMLSLHVSRMNPILILPYPFNVHGGELCSRDFV